MRSWRDWSWADGNFWDSGVQPQLVINLAESHGYSDRLRHLDIRPHAHAGLLLAADWLTSYATPSILNELSTLACHDDLARELLTIRSTRQFAPCT